ncbi:MAG: PAS domain S-box protein [Desulfobacteraceae bacterium]
MKLRLILLILAVSAFIFACLGSFMYYSSLKNTARLEAKRQGTLRIDTLKSALSSYLNEYKKPAKTLAQLAELKNALIMPGKTTIEKANVILDSFQHSLKAEACYLMNTDGLTMASSNRHAPDSFLGQNFAFRPYFKESIAGRPYMYLALGTTSHKRGAYYSRPVYSYSGSRILGVAVIKASIELIESRLITDDNEAFHVVDKNGIIFISSNPELLYKTVSPLTEEEEKKIRASKQFGRGPWKPSDRNLEQHLVHRMNILEDGSWQLVFMQDIESATKRMYGPIIRTTGMVALFFTLFLGAAIFVLYNLASRELNRSRIAEEKLKASEELYRSIYHNTPAMLHSINRECRLINVSSYWLEMTGYTKEEVMGRKLTDFFSPESRHRAETKILPEFFQGPGINRDIPYQLIKKDKSTMEILLSCYGIRDENGEINRTLAISVDITDRVRQRKELERIKKEKVSATIMEKQELERGIIARELHDELGQTLTALKMDAVWITGKIGNDQKNVRDRARNISALTDKTIKDVKSLAFRLRPGSLDDLGLADSIESLVRDFEKRTNINVTFTPCPMPEPGYTQKTAIYRIIQEALTNCAKYADASAADIEFTFEQNTLKVSITDDGKGFDMTRTNHKETLGLTGMKERATLAGGEIRIRSNPGKGTSIVLIIDNMDETYTV